MLRCAWCHALPRMLCLACVTSLQQKTFWPQVPIVFTKLLFCRLLVCLLLGLQYLMFACLCVVRQLECDLFMAQFMH